MNRLSRFSTSDNRPTSAAAVAGGATTGARLVAVTGLALLLVVALLAVAPPARAAIWVTSPGTKVFPGTSAGAKQAITLSAAGGEYEGAIVAVRGATSRTARLTWSDDTTQFLKDNAVLDQVKFVRISKPTTGLGSKPGLYPDPLVPRSFDQGVLVPAHSSSFYVLFHVPYGTPAGDYTGALHVVNGAGESADLPVTLTVWPFGWKKLSVRTQFGCDFNHLGSNINGTYQLLLEHGVNPQMPKVTARTTSGGTVDRSRYATKLGPWLADDGLAMPLVCLPWRNWTPPYAWKYTPHDPRLLRFLTGVCAVYKNNGWQARAIAYPIDEPHSTARERQAEGLAQTLHKASARSGFRCKFLLTDDPRPTTLNSTSPANRFLWNDVDIWCTRYFYFFGRVPVLRKCRAQYGSQIWWYPYANSRVKTMPNFMIDKSLADERVWGWLMYSWKVDGMLYWGVSEWGKRDPYQNPLSYTSSDGRRFNGEAVLIYPGYYPRYGLKDHNAPCNSSLRLELLRDGYEDLEYMKLAATAAGRTWVQSVVKKITWYPYAVRYGHILDKYPKYTTSAAAYLSARKTLAAKIVAAMNQ